MIQAATSPVIPLSQTKQAKKRYDATRSSWFPQGEKISTNAIQEACQQAQKPNLRAASDQKHQQSPQGHGAAENQLVEKTCSKPRAHTRMHAHTRTRTQYSNGHIHIPLAKNIKVGVFLYFFLINLNFNLT